MFGTVNFGLSNAQQGSGTDPEASVPVINGTVVISGTPEIGEVLSLTGYTIGGFPIPTETYQWYADDVEIVGATEATYEIQAGDDGVVVTCTLTATNTEGSDDQTTAGVTITFPDPVNTVAPAISATGKIGTQVDGADGTWSNSPSFTYQWQFFDSTWQDIVGATSQDYTPAETYDGMDIRLAVTGTNSGGSATANSNSCAVTYNAPQSAGDLSPAALTVGVVIDELDFEGQVSVSGDADLSGGSWSVQVGSVPDGLSRTGGSVTGTPTTEQAESALTLRYTNSGGHVDVSCDITITEETGISYAYEVVADTAPGSTNFNASYTIDNPVAGQKIIILCISEEALSGTPSIGGSTTGVTVRETDTFGSDIVTVIEKVGFDGASLEVDINFAATNSFLVLHGWQTTGLDYLANSLVSGQQAASNTTSTVLAYTKATDDVGFIGVRKYTGVSGSPSPVQDFGNGSTWAGHLAEGASFSGDLTATTPTTITNKFAAVFTMTPSA